MKNKLVVDFKTFINENVNKEDIITIRDVAEEHPEMYDYYYKWRNTDEPELEKDLIDVLEEYGYVMSQEDIDEFYGSYNDIKGYLNIEVTPIRIGW